MATVDNPSVLNSLSSLNALAGKISPQSNSNNGGDSSSSGSTNSTKQHNGKYEEHGVEMFNLVRSVRSRTLSRHEFSWF
ncbi:hypothetical protein Pcinc_040489 [Petrolisthes cinctipes]|uniref:Uncharacterized protein n=1 Tax=Petrolisthes cinctipes TaxID=88211 RepID=A0AAE1EHY8_PETCI|nr:hypothetical protein Pcinc_040489 [Petrolisthes cinctipes]